MKKTLHILGGILLASGIICAVYIIVAVATKNPGVSTFWKTMPAVTFHVLFLFSGMALLGAGQQAQDR